MTRIGIPSATEASTLVWINGAHGAGKTSVARRLLAMRPGAKLVDPEQVGRMLRRTWPGIVPQDFKDLPVWRELTLGLLRAAATDSGGPFLVVPMTLDDRGHLAEVVGGLREAGIDVLHFTLTASAETLSRRLWRRLDWPRSRRWAQDRAGSSAAKLADPAFAVHIPTEGRRIDEVAAEIVVRVDARS